MEFKKYDSIENSYRDKFINKIIEEGYDSIQYNVYEKVHGANFAFYINEDEIICAKRSGFIKEGEGFFNYEKVYDKYAEKLRTMFIYIKGLDGLSNMQELRVCCELYGGVYPHPDVKKSNSKGVQGGVFYNPEQDMLVFDMMCDGFYLDALETEGNCDLLGIPHLKPLFSGNLKECLEYNNEFQTTIPATLGLPEIENNICEGVVIKPSTPKFLWDQTRLIIKNKNDKFSEKTGGAGKGVKKEEVVLPFAVIGAMSVSEQYVTENRLRNVLSKIGDVSQKDFGKIVSLFNKDVIEDFLKENEEFKELGKSDRKIVTKKIGQITALLLRKNFTNILDGEF